MIKINDLTYKIEHQQIIENINLEINQNEHVAIIGPSGCGKSTLLKIILGLIKPSSGTVKINNTSIGYMPQKELLLPWLTIGENINIPNEIKGSKLSDHDLQKQLNEFHLNTSIDKYPDELSGGMQSRINLIRALNMSDELILLDEPFAKLDYLTHIKITDWYQKTLSEKQMTSVLVTHNIDEAIKLATRIIVLSPKPAKVTHQFVTSDYHEDELKEHIINALI